MALTENGMDTTMLVSPNGSNNGGLFGGGDSWLGILFLIALCGGGFGFGGGFGGDGIYPWLNNSQNINDGFRDQQMATQIGGIQNSITSGFGDMATALCGGFASVNASVNGAQNALTQQLYSNQIADLERSYAAQTANIAGLTNLSQQLATCYCENKTATNDVKYSIAQEAAATRATNAANTQAILDKLCAIELDTVKAQLAQAQRENVALQNAVNMSALRESQTAQTAAILAGQTSEVDALYDRLKNCPVNSVPVYGNQPIFTYPTTGTVSAF